MLKMLIQGFPWWRISESYYASQLKVGLRDDWNQTCVPFVGVDVKPPGMQNLFQQESGLVVSLGLFQPWMFYLDLAGDSTVFLEISPALDDKFRILWNHPPLVSDATSPAIMELLQFGRFGFPYKSSLQNISAIISEISRLISSYIYIYT